MKLPGALSKLFGRRKVTPPPSVDKSVVLGLVPIRNPAVEWRKYKSGEVAIVVSTKRRGLMARIDKAEKKKKIILDKMGSHVWMLCDGEHTFGDIAEDLVKTYKMHRREAELSLARYFDTLMKKGLVSFIPGKLSTLREGGEVKQETPQTQENV